MFVLSRNDSQDSQIVFSRSTTARIEASPPPSKAAPLERQAQFHRHAADGQTVLSVLLGGGAAAVGMMAPMVGAGMGLASAAAAGAAHAHSQEAAAAERQAAEIREAERKDAEAKAAADKKEAERRASEKAAQDAAAAAAAAAAQATQNQRDATDFDRGIRTMRGDTYGGRASAIDRDRSDSISRTC